MNLITNPAKLQNAIEPQQMTSDNINDITLILLAGLKKYGGIGLSANQLGLNVRACVINVKEPLVLINPKIVEQCLSIPKSMKKPIKTVRHKSITVECDNLGTVVFGPENQFSDWKDANEFFGDEGLLECVCAQHEIDHLNGILITDQQRRYSTTYIAPKSYGRNEMVMVKLPSGETEFMKYKHAQKVVGAEIL